MIKTDFCTLPRASVLRPSARYGAWAYFDCTAEERLHTHPRFTHMRPLVLEAVTVAPGCRESVLPHLGPHQAIRGTLDSHVKHRTAQGSLNSWVGDDQRILGVAWFLAIFLAILSASSNSRPSHTVTRHISCGCLQMQIRGSSGPGMLPLDLPQDLHVGARWVGLSQFVRKESSRYLIGRVCQSLAPWSHLRDQLHNCSGAGKGTATP